MSLLRLPSFFSPNNVSMNLLRNCLIKQINAMMERVKLRDRKPEIITQIALKNVAGRDIAR